MCQLQVPTNAKFRVSEPIESGIHNCSVLYLNWLRFDLVITKHTPLIHSSIKCLSLGKGEGGKEVGGLISIILISVLWF